MVTLASGCWTTVDSAKIHMGLVTTDLSQDDLVTQLINASKKICEHYLKHPILTSSYTEYYSGDNTNSLILRKWPVISITSIHVDPNRLWTSDTLMDSSSYYLDEETGIIEIFTALGSGPQWFERGIRNIRVIYPAGFAVVPDDLIQAANEHVSWMFRRANTEGLRSMTLGGKSEQYDDSFLPAWLRQKLDNYADRTV